MNKTFRYLFLLFLITTYIKLQAQSLNQPYFTFPREENQHLDLSKNWNLNYMDEAILSPAGLPEDGWINVDAPTSTHMAFFKAGLLPDPYTHLHSKEYLWMKEKTWYYNKEFVPEEREGKYAILSFDGLDYYSRVWLNDSLLGNHEGILGGPSIEISNLLKPNEPNKLVVELKLGHAHYETPHPQHPGEIVKPYEFMGYTGVEPFFTIGMWRGVRIDYLDKTHIERPFLTTESVNGNTARLKLKVEVFHEDHSLNHELHPWDGWRLEPEFRNYHEARKAQRNYQIQIRFFEKGQNDVAFEKLFPLDIYNGRNWFNQEFSLQNAKLWWPNGLGKPNLYDVEIVLLEEGKPIDQIRLEYGIRKIIQKPTAGPQVLDYWKDWQFEINGKEIFVKGINWMPVDALLELPREEYRWLLQMARDAGFQMLRVWGCGLVETDDFYELCNEFGLMVLQDFPIGNSLTPEWPQRVWESQILWNVFRLRNHPSLTVYCGGNEFNSYAHDNAATMGILQRSLHDFDGTRMFLPHSPFGGALHPYPDMDPTWYGRMYRWVPFITETGIHSFCPPEGLRRIVDNDEFSDLESLFSEDFVDNHPEFSHHFVQFNVHMVPKMLSRGSHILNMQDDPTIEDLALATQIGAGEFYQLLSEDMQGNYPYTAGLLPWTYKRPWPVVSAIHLIDGFGQPSAPYYFLKRTYEPVHVMLDIERLFWAPDDTMKLVGKVLNLTSFKGMKGMISIELYDDKFKVVYKKKARVETQKAPSVNQFNLGEFVIPGKYTDRYLFANVELADDNGNLISRSVYWPRSLSLMQDSDFRNEYLSKPVAWPTLDKGPWLKPTVAETKTNLETSVTKLENSKEGYSKVILDLENKGNTPAFMVQVNMSGSYRRFYCSDNNFWLSPGEMKTIEVTIDWQGQMPKESLLEVKAWNSNLVQLQVIEVR